MGLLRALSGLRTALAKTETALLVGIAAVMILMAFLQVILREVFSAGILWGDIFLRHLVLWAGFLGGAIAAEKKSHFAIDVLQKALPERTRAFVSLAIHAAAVACLVLLVRAAVDFYRYELDAGSILFTAGEVSVPEYALNSIIPAGFILLAVHFFLNGLTEALEMFFGSGR